MVIDINMRIIGEQVEPGFVKCRWILCCVFLWNIILFQLNFYTLESSTLILFTFIDPFIGADIHSFLYD